MDGRNTLYSENETISSPVKSLLMQQHQHQNEVNINEKETFNKQRNGTKDIRNFLSKASEQAKSYLGKSLENIKEQYEKKKNVLFKKEQSKTKRTESPKKSPVKKSRIFLTRSSKEFAQIKIEENLNTASCFVYPVVGACIVALPYALKQSGLVMGVLSILLISLSLEYSEYLLTQCSMSSDEYHIPTLAKKLFGKVGYVVYFGVPYLFQFTILLAYFIILGDTGTKCFSCFLEMVRPSGSDLHRNIVLAITLLFVIPVSFTNSMKRLSQFSVVSIAISSFLMMVIVVKFFTSNEQIPKEIYHPFKYFGANIVQSLAVVTFTLSCHHRNRLVYMKVNTSRLCDKNKPADIVASYALLLSIVVACGGYATVNIFTQGDILENYCEEDLLSSFARVAFTILVVCLFPLECQNIRYLTDELVIVHKRFKHVFYFGLTLLILVPGFIASLFIDCLPVIAEASGILFAIPMVYVLPPLLFIKQYPGNLLTVGKLPCVIFICFGLIVGGIGCFVTIFSKHHCIHTTALFPYCNGSSDLVGPLITLMSLNTSLSEDDFMMTNNFNMSQLEKYGFENLTDFVNAYFA